VTRWQGPNGYWASDDQALIDIDYVQHWLSTESYWARNRPRQVTEKAIAHSLNMGLYSGSGAQVGFCRWVTDGATFAWLCDVFTDPAHRGQGLGIFLVKVATEHPTVAGLRLLLGTGDAHGLYRKFGFTSIGLPERLMEVWREQPAPHPDLAGGDSP
jgi:GNAT superfamily N-acetyltransferase